MRKSYGVSLGDPDYEGAWIEIYSEMASAFDHNCGTYHLVVQCLMNDSGVDAGAKVIGGAGTGTIIEMTSANRITVTNGEGSNKWFKIKVWR